MSGLTGGYNSPSPGAGNIATSGSTSDVRAIGSSTPVEHAGSTGSGEGAVDVGVDPASHNFFSPDYRNSRHEDLRQMLEGNKDQQKLEAMKRIIGMVAKGKDASDLFPAVVKNVVSKNIEVKKLVYVYLVRYAEEQQDLALLSISTFQRALKDPNQLIRASALRVLSSIRVAMIVPIMMLAIKESASDMSPYVRKTAAVAIPKMYSLDPEQKEECVQVIEKLLADRTTLVAGAVVAAFEEVCPDRIDLIHKNYRKLCSLLVDVDEWGQVIIINMLTRYARTQFLDPNKGHDPGVDTDDPKNFYESDSKDTPAAQNESESTPPPPPRVAMDPDHRLLLRTCKPLLQSRNNAVVMAVAQLYYYLAPRAEVALCVRALVRLLRSHREGQYVVLSNIVSMSLRRKDMFEPYLKSFFVRSNSDPLHIRLLKLEILTNLATESNISAILREFQTYISQTDKEFVAATIQAIGRCASNIKGVSDTCLNGLVSLLSKKDEAVVAESVVVVKKLLQTQPSEHKAIITHMAKLVHDITVPMARASILWLLGEYSDQVPKIAPDVLRVMAKNFTNEEDIVKLQILNLAAKLHITNAKQTSLLAQYVFQLAKYDQNYDLRDRARFLRTMIIPEDNGSQGLLAKHAKKIFLSTKPAPVLESKFKDSDQFQLGTLSHIIGSRANGYHPLPDFPNVAPDPSARVVEVASPIARASMGIVKTVAVKDKGDDPAKGFYSESEEDEEGVDSSGTTESADSGEEESEEESESEEEEDESRSESGEEDEKKKSATIPTEELSAPVKASGIEDESEEEEEESDVSDDSDDDDEDDESEEEEISKKPVKKKPLKLTESSTAAPAAAPATPATPSSLLLDLLDFDAIGSPTSAMPLMPTSNAGLLLAPKMADLSLLDGESPSIHSTYVSSYSAPLKELLSSLVGGGLVVQYRFTRAPNLHSDKAATVELVLTNGSEEELNQIKIGDTRIPNGMKFYEFPVIASLPPKGGRTAVTIGVDFNDSIQKIGFDLDVGGRVHPLALTPPVGEIGRACTMSEDNFAKEKKKLAGMNEHAAKLSLDASASASVSMQSLVDAVLSAGAFGQVSSAEENSAKMASKSMATSALSLVTIVKNETDVAVIVNSEKLMFGSLLLKDIKTALEMILK